MENRRSFLSLVTSGSVALSLMAREASAQSAPPAPPADTPAPKPTATVKPASAVAIALATAMRRFDPNLSAADVETIALGIDAQRELGPLLAPKKKPLRNADEPLTAVRIPDRGA